MKGQRECLVLDTHQRLQGCDIGEGRANLCREWGNSLYSGFSLSRPQLRAVAAYGRTLNRSEQGLECSQSSAADKGKRAIRLRNQAAEIPLEVGGNDDLLWRRRDVDQRPIDVQEKRVTRWIEGWQQLKSAAELAFGQVRLLAGSHGNNWQCHLHSTRMPGQAMPHRTFPDGAIASGMRQRYGGIHQRYMREGLRKISQHATGAGIIFFREQSYVVAEL